MKFRHVPSNRLIGILVSTVERMAAREDIDWLEFEMALQLFNELHTFSLWEKLVETSHAAD